MIHRLDVYNESWVKSKHHTERSQHNLNGVDVIYVWCMAACVKVRVKVRVVKNRPGREENGK